MQAEGELHRLQFTLQAEVIVDITETSEQTPCKTNYCNQFAHVNAHLKLTSKQKRGVGQSRDRKSAALALTCAYFDCLTAIRVRFFWACVAQMATGLVVQVVGAGTLCALAARCA